ncbi:MAG: S8 family serine peptidase [Halobacteriovoraceae bacterium]|nr:S8 family serine peptidase [Halobacteriovoraceae bacterium]
MRLKITTPIAKKLEIAIFLFLSVASVQAFVPKNQQTLQRAPEVDLRKAIDDFNTSVDLSPSYSKNDLPKKYLNWGLYGPTNSHINLLEGWKLFHNKGHQVVVAVIDTGVDIEQDHLKNNIVVKSGIISVRNYGKDFSQLNKSGQIVTSDEPKDTHGHGTHVSGIIKSIFPDVKLLPLKYYNPMASGKQSLDATIKALNYAVNNDVDIINYSGGGPQGSQEELEVLARARQKGILIVAAAGNEESNIDKESDHYYPASYGLDNIISVSAHNQSLKLIKASNYGQKSVDLSAPGDSINSSLVGNRSGTLTGTSQATAFVTGVAALIKANYPQATAKQLKDIIRSSAKVEPGLIGKSASNGRLDVASALRFSQTYFEGEELKKRQLATEKFNKRSRGPGSIIFLKKDNREKETKEIESAI